MNADAFLLELRIRALSPAELASIGKTVQNYELTAPFTFASKAAGMILVPAGFVTDFASVPRIVWSYISPEDPAILFASVIHDFLYTRGGRIGSDLAVSRAVADAVLREGMLASGARPAQAWVVFRSVRLFGASHWNGRAES